LEEFLEEASLVGDTDDWDAKNDRVTLMTLHASKGLEFPVVFLVAVEEGLLPHQRSRERPDQIEEERRLMFVGITRAEEELEISRAHYRDFRGERKMTVPSQFLMELPRSEMEIREQEPAAVSRDETEFGNQTADVAPGPDEPVCEVSIEPAYDERPGNEPPLPVERKPRNLHLTTAAELHAGEPLPPVSPDAFRQGMVVRHPAHGLGRIIALSGAGRGRKATVDFVSPARRVQFVIAASPLRPVRYDRF
jgi:DNA helicase-2/ATP-dependent DNA helicase PcrA